MTLAEKGQLSLVLPQTYDIPMMYEGLSDEALSRPLATVST